MLKAAIFDMDGLLINSDSFWEESIREIVADFNIDLTNDLYKKFSGFRIDEAIQFLFNYKPWNTVSVKEVRNNVVEMVNRKINLEGDAMPGVQYILEFFKSRNIKIGLASSSPSSMINNVLTKLEIGPYFEIISSGENEQYGKPHPAIYLNTLKKFGINYFEAIVFEDSMNGIIAAKAAKIPTVAVPEEEQFLQGKFDVADLKIHSLLEFNEKHISYLNF